jgi:hypothetical protein
MGHRIHRTILQCTPVPPYPGATVPPGAPYPRCTVPPVHRTPGATAPPVSPVAGEPVTGGPVIHRHRCMPKF